jgi:hypothetical protein
MKYDALHTYLLGQTANEVPMTFAEIEKLIGQRLPASARKHRPWWSNNPHNNVMTKAWLNAGFQSERVDLGSEKLVFRCVGRATPLSKSVGGDPLAGLFGAMRGTVRLLPDVDLTQPTGERWAAEEDE